MTNAVLTSHDAGRAISRQGRPGIEVTSVDGPAHREFHLTLRPLPGETPAFLIRRLAEKLRETRAAVIRQEIFGSVAAHGEVQDALWRALGEPDWPVTWVEGADCAGGAVAGMHVWAIAGGAVETISQNGRPIGRVFTDGLARHCVLGDVQPDDSSAPKTVQARQTLENLAAALREAGMEMTHLVRTWLFLDDLLSWYSPFNSVRTEFYRQRKMFDNLVPASTGVSGRNPTGSALTAGAWAVQPLTSALVLREVPSPLQCPASAYGSSFSRALELASPDQRRLLVSGTASIDPHGRTTCVGDLHGQIELTMRVVQAILDSSRLDFSDATRVTAYFKNLQDAPAFAAWRASRGLVHWPLVLAQSDICRDDLLFELELDAIAPPTKG
jgi:enamine deaminase RidA (YjgF/YER057c/UK114 family)